MVASRFNHIDVSHLSSLNFIAPPFPETLIPPIETFLCLEIAAAIAFVIATFSRRKLGLFGRATLPASSSRVECGGNDSSRGERPAAVCAALQKRRPSS